MIPLILAKATVLMALALLCRWMARHHRASVRHAVLAAMFAGLIILPIASLVAPPVRISIPTAAPVPAARTFPARPVAASARVGTVPPAASLPLPALLLAGWLTGTGLFLLPLIVGLWKVRSLRRTALPWSEGESLGVPWRVEVLLHGGLAGPMAFGVAHPAIMLPEDARGWNEQDVSRAIVHELEHVRRYDWLIQCVARAVCAVYWFHPLVWVAWRKLTLEAERSCDDAVLARSEATGYADQLVGLARRLSTASKSPVPAMANRSDLATRVRAVLDTRQKRGRAGKPAVILTCAAALILVFTMASLRMTAAPQAGGATIQLSATTLLVQLPLTVTDQNGRPIEGLNANDFAVTEDGVQETISIFEASPGGSYILGYYTRNQNADGQFRQIKITRKDNSFAKLDHRAGYYLRVVPPVSTAALAEPGITPPQLLRKVEAEYSDAARKAKYQGLVLLSIVVGLSGEVINVRVVRSLGLELDERAIDAVKQWRFKPATKNGNPVEANMIAAVSFRLL